MLNMLAKHVTIFLITVLTFIMLVQSIIFRSALLVNMAGGKPRVKRKAERNQNRGLLFMHMLLGHHVVKCTHPVNMLNHTRS